LGRENDTRRVVIALLSCSFVKRVGRILVLHGAPLVLQVYVPIFVANNNSPDGAWTEPEGAYGAGDGW